MRLADGNATAGRVEICFSGVWGVVCDNHWDIRDARVTCRELELPFLCEQCCSIITARLSYLFFMQFQRHFQVHYMVEVKG